MVIESINKTSRVNFFRLNLAHNFYVITSDVLKKYIFGNRFGQKNKKTMTFMQKN